MMPSSSGHACSAPDRSLTLSAHVDGELGPGQALDVDAHLRDCAACAERVRLLQATRASLQRAAAPRCPRGLRARIARLLSRNRAAAALSGRLSPLRYAVAAAAGVALLLGAAQHRWRAEKAPAAPPADPEALAPASVESMLGDLIALHARPLPPETTNPDDLPTFDPYVGVPVRKPAFQPFSADFKGARIHAIRDRRAALLQYTLPSNHRVTIYLFDPRRFPMQTAPSLRPRVIRERPVYVGRVQGYSVAACEREGVGYALATDLGDDESTRLVLSAVQ